MEIEVYSSSKPGIAWRAWVSAVVLFLGVCLLSYSMASNRGARLLIPRVHHEGWDISYQVPQNFESVTVDPVAADTNELLATYRMDAPTGGTAELSIHRFVVEPGTNAARICLHILNRQSPLLQRLLATPAARSDAAIEMLGPLEAVEIMDRTTGNVVRATVVDKVRAYAVSLRVEGIPLDAALYAYFDITCASIEIVNPG